VDEGRQGRAESGQEKKNAEKKYASFRLASR